MLGTYVLEKYQYENVPPFALDNIALRISLFTTFMYFKVVIVYEIHQFALKSGFRPISCVHEGFPFVKSCISP